jgi:hypothetical protein
MGGACQASRSGTALLRRVFDMPRPTEEANAYAETSLDSEAATAIAAEAADATAGALASS